MGRRQTGNIEKAGGFLFRWDGTDEEGMAYGTVWRDNTEQDFGGMPEAFITETHLSRVTGKHTEQITIRGTEYSNAMVMTSLEVAAGWVWGYSAGRSDAASMGRCVLCARDVPRRFLGKLTDDYGGGLACSPLNPENMAKCQRIAREGRA